MADQVDSPTDGAVVAYAGELRRWRERRGLSKQKLADRMAYDRSYVSHIESAKMTPSEGFTRLAEDILDTGGALWTRWEAILEERATEDDAPGSRHAQRDLTTVEFVAWLADHSTTDFAVNYQAVSALAERLEIEPASVRHARSHARGKVTRADLADAMASYYQPPAGDHGLYRASVDGDDLTLSLLTKQSWLGTAVQLGTDQEQVSFQPPTGSVAALDETARLAAIARLAEVEITGTMMVNSPIYNLVDIDLEPGRLDATITIGDFAGYALTCDLMEAELVDMIVTGGAAATTPGRLPVRDQLMPTIDAATDFPSRQNAGGPASLLAIARPASGGRPADYALLIQERSGRVLNAAGKLAVIPKAFHQPIGDPAEEAQLSATLTREFEEELLGREDLEQLSAEQWRHVDLLHLEHRSEPMAWLLEHWGEAFRTECTGFGINLVTGTYEFACLTVIHDETWWTQWGHLVEANWEAMRVHRHSTRDTDGLATLACDPRWSNEGLFAYLEGLRRLAELDDTGRVAAPPIHLLET